MFIPASIDVTFTSPFGTDVDRRAKATAPGPVVCTIAASPAPGFELAGTVTGRRGDRLNAGPARAMERYPSLRRTQVSQIEVRAGGGRLPRCAYAGVGPGDARRHPCVASARGAQSAQPAPSTSPKPAARASPGMARFCSLCEG